MNFVTNVIIQLSIVHQLSCPMQKEFSSTSSGGNNFQLCDVNQWCVFYPNSDPASAALQHDKKRKYPQLPDSLSAKLRWTY